MTGRCLALAAIFVTSIAAAPAQQTQPPPRPSFALAAADQLSALGAWDKAEEQYLKLESTASASERAQALAGIKNARQHILDDKRAGAFAAARAFERLKRWKDAEQAYIDIVKSDPGAARDAAAAADRIKARITNDRWPEVVDDWSLKLGRILLIFSVVLAIFLFSRAIRKARTSIRFQPFKASSEDAAKQMAFWLESSLADLQSPAPTYPAWPGLVNTLALMRLPGIGEDLELEDVEIGGFKVPFKQLLQIVAVPRARVSGNWYVGAVTGSAYVAVEKRKGFGFELSSSVRRPVNSTAGPLQDDDLQRFAYAVFIEAAR